MPGGQWEQNRAWQHAVVEPQNLQYCKQTPEGARDYELLKKKLENLSNWEIDKYKPEKLHPPEKGFRVHWNVAGLIG